MVALCTEQCAVHCAGARDIIIIVVVARIAKHGERVRAAYLCLEMLLVTMMQITEQLVRREVDGRRLYTGAGNSTLRPRDELINTRTTTAQHLVVLIQRRYYLVFMHLPLRTC
jgi:hypothetical protein